MNATRAWSSRCVCHTFFCRVPSTDGFPCRRFLASSLISSLALILESSLRVWGGNTSKIEGFEYKRQKSSALHANNLKCLYANKQPLAVNTAYMQKLRTVPPGRLNLLIRLILRETGFRPERTIGRLPAPPGGRSMSNTDTAKRKHWYCYCHISIQREQRIVWLLNVVIHTQKYWIQIQASPSKVHWLLDNVNVIEHLLSYVPIKLRGPLTETSHCFSFLQVTPSPASSLPSVSMKVTPSIEPEIVLTNNKSWVKEQNMCAWPEIFEILIVNIYHLSILIFAVEELVWHFKSELSLDIRHPTMPTSAKTYNVLWGALYEHYTEGQKEQGLSSFRHHSRAALDDQAFVESSIKMCSEIYVLNSRVLRCQWRRPRSLRHPKQCS